MELQEERLGKSTKKMPKMALCLTLSCPLEHFQSPGPEGFFNGFSSITLIFETTTHL